MKNETHTFWNNAGEPATVTRKTSTSLPGLAIDRWDKADVPAGLGRWVVTHLPTDKRALRMGRDNRRRVRLATDGGAPL